MIPILLMHAVAAAHPDITSTDVHSVIDGLIVICLFTMLGMLAKLLRSQRRNHEALWGFQEGERSEPGIVDIIRGNGHGSLLSVCEAAMSQAVANGEALIEHINEADERWEEIKTGIASLQSGQADAAKTAVAVALDLHGKPTPPVKKAPAKKATVRKRAAPKKAPQETAA